MLAIKTKTFRDLLDESPFKKSDIVSIQDPENLAARDLASYDYVKGHKKVDGEVALVQSSPAVCSFSCIADSDNKDDPLRGINVEASGGASKVLKMIADKVCCHLAP